MSTVCTQCIFLGQSKLPSVTDEYSLEDDLNSTSEGLSQRSDDTSGISSLPNTSGSLPSDFEDSSMAEQILSETQRTSAEGLNGDSAVNGVNTADEENELEVEGGEYSSIDIGDIRDVISPSPSVASSIADSVKTDVSTKDVLDVSGESLRKGVSDPRLMDSDDVGGLTDTDYSESVEVGDIDVNSVRDGYIGDLYEDVPLLYCTRLLCSRFLLTGHQQGLISDRQVSFVHFYATLKLSSDLMSCCLYMRD